MNTDVIDKELATEQLDRALDDKCRLLVDLEETCKVRDEWCAEYVRVRDELAALKRKIRTLDE